MPQHNADRTLSEKVWDAHVVRTGLSSKCYKT